MSVCVNCSKDFKAFYFTSVFVSYILIILFIRTMHEFETNMSFHGVKVFVSKIGK